MMYGALPRCDCFIDEAPDGVELADRERNDIRGPIRVSGLSSIEATPIAWRIRRIDDRRDR
jgi:hypothetical protein